MKDNIRPEWIVFIIVLWGLPLCGQLIVIPQLGMDLTAARSKGEELLQIDQGWQGPFWNVGLEVGYGMSENMALGLRYTLGRPRLSLNTGETTPMIPVESMTFYSHEWTLRMKYAIGNILFLNGGIEFRKWSGLQVRYALDDFYEDTTQRDHHFLGLNLGAEVVWHRFLLGIHYHYDLNVGSANEGVNNVQVLGLSFGYFFNFKIKGNDPWEKKCPKF